MGCNSKQWRISLPDSESFYLFVLRPCSARVRPLHSPERLPIPPVAAIVGAQVVALNVQTNLERTVASGSTGNYVLPQLPPGQYSVSITKQGFAPNQQNNIVLEIGQVAEIDVTLSAGSEEQRVVVTASVPTIQTADSSIGSVVDSQTIVNTPLNGRLSVMGLMTLSPGVSKRRSSRSDSNLRRYPVYWCLWP